MAADGAAARQIVEMTVKEMASGHRGKTRYRDPLIGYAGADDPRWEGLRDTVVPGHFLPSEVLPGARSIAAFFLPFEDSIVKGNKAAEFVSYEWSVAYIETNTLLGEITAEIEKRLKNVEISAAWQKPTHNYDPALMRARWSHKSAAVIAGLGGLGLHQMLITRSGCAGRVSSIVIGVDIPVDTPQEGAVQPAPRVCGFSDGKCDYCLRICPGSAITGSGLDKIKCRARLTANGNYLRSKGFESLISDVCGKCATGPCSRSAFGL